MLVQQMIAIRSWACFWSTNGANQESQEKREENKFIQIQNLPFSKKVEDFNGEASLAIGLFLKRFLPKESCQEIIHLPIQLNKRTFFVWLNNSIDFD